MQVFSWDIMVFLILLILVLVIIILIVPVQVRINSLKEQPGEALIRIGFINWQWGFRKKIKFPFKNITALNKEQLLLFLRNYKKRVCGKKPGNLFRKLLQKGKLRRLYWQLYLGNEDYAITGILTGICWIVIELILAKLNVDTIIETDGIDVKVIPEFGNNHCQLDFDCIFEIRIIHIIIEILNSLRFRYA